MNPEDHTKFPKTMTDELITEAKADEVGVWLIAARLQDELGPLDDVTEKALTLELVLKQA